MSETIAETVGSLMNINSGTGKQLQPENFSVEIHIRFNLGSLNALFGLLKVVAKKYGVFQESSTNGSCHTYYMYCN